MNATTLLGTNYMNDGTILWYSPIKGYGFISTETRECIFFHRSNIIVGGKELKTGDRVIFDLYISARMPNGNEAKNVRKID